MNTIDTKQRPRWRTRHDGGGCIITASHRGNELGLVVIVDSGEISACSMWQQDLAWSISSQGEAGVFIKIFYPKPGTQLGVVIFKVDVLVIEGRQSVRLKETQEI